MDFLGGGLEEIESQKSHDQDVWTCVCSDGEILFSLQQFQQHSEYFAALIRSELDELSKRKVNLELISTRTISCIQKLFDMLDSTQFELEVDVHVFNELSHWSDQRELDVLMTAIDYLDIHSLRRLCDKYLCSLDEISEDNISYLLQLYTRFSFTLLRKKLLRYLLENVADVTSELIELLPFSLLQCLVESKKCNVSSEWDLVNILDTWCSKHCRTPADHHYISKLVKLIKIPNLAEQNDCGKHLEQVHCLPLRHNLKSSICEYESDPETYVTHHPSSCQSRRGKRLLLAMRMPFGRTLDRACSFAKDFSLEDNQDMVFHESRQLSLSIPCHSLREFCVCVLGNHVYVAGGQRKYSLAGTFAVAELYTLDLDSLEWSVASPMSTSRCLFHMDVVEHRLYSVGGINADGELDSVEMYDPDADVWSGVSALDYKIHEHAGCVHKDKLYVSGGHDGCSHVDTVSLYDSETDTWSRCASLLTTRSCHSMTCLGDRLYVIGGSRIRKFKVEVMQSIECYSTVTDQWSEVQARLPSTYTACLSVYARPLSSRLLVLGGYSYKGRRYALEMHSFCERTCTWRSIPVCFSSTRQKKTELTFRKVRVSEQVCFLEIRVNKHMAEKLVKNRRTCTLKK